jgi:hypothetical protein
MGAMIFEDDLQIFTPSLSGGALGFVGREKDNML